MNPMVGALKNALTYTRLYRGQTFVIKIGGEVLASPEQIDNVALQLALLDSLSIRLVVVHGGGPQATELSERLGLGSEFVAGRRVTSKGVLEVAKMVCGGQVSIDLLAALKRHAVSAVGLSGVDGGLVQATRRPPVIVDGREVDYGFVGDVQSVELGPVSTLLEGGFVPVVAPLAVDDEGQVLNVNADTMAQALARALGAEKLIFLTRVAGLLRDAGDPRSLVEFADPPTLEGWLADGTISGGMRPKVEACIEAVRAGVHRSHIIDGTSKDAVLLEIFTGVGCGTMIVRQAELDQYRSAEL